MPVPPLLSQAVSRLRHTPRRGVALAVAAVPALLLAYSVVLIPFRPGIRDIRKAKLELPARVMSADGKELVVFNWGNREWVGLSDISPQVTAALIATEDHRFYEHHGIDFYRLGGAVLRTFSGDRQGGFTAVIPYFGYARQDRKDKPRVPISAKLVANILQASGVNRIMTMDLHAEQIQGFFDIPVDHLKSEAIFIPYLAKLDLNNVTFASPEVGGVKRARSYAKYFEEIWSFVIKKEGLPMK